MRLAHIPTLAMALLVAACGGPGGELSATTTGITTVQPGSAQVRGLDRIVELVRARPASGQLDERDTGLDTSTGSALPDLPGFETLGPVQGCGKIDILFVITDGGLHCQGG
jgi:hypothetical protein